MSHAKPDLRRRGIGGEALTMSCTAGVQVAIKIMDKAVLAKTVRFLSRHASALQSVVASSNGCTGVGWILRSGDTPCQTRV